MSKMISVRLSDRQVAALDSVVKDGRYATRTEAVRRLLDEFTKQVEQAVLAREFRAAYATAPTEDEQAMHEFMDAAAEALLAGDGGRIARES